MNIFVGFIFDTSHFDYASATHITTSCLIAFWWLMVTKKCFLLTFKAEQPQRMFQALLMSLMHYFYFLNITKQNKLMHRCNFEYLIPLNSWCIIFILNISLMHPTSWQFFTFSQWTKNNLSPFQDKKWSFENSVWECQMR